MKKVLIIIVIIFVLASILTFNFSLQAAQNFQEFEDDGNGDDDDDSIIPQIILNKSIIPINSKIERDEIYVYYVLSMFYGYYIGYI